VTQNSPEGRGQVVEAPGLSAFRADNFPDPIRGLPKALQENPSDAPRNARDGLFQLRQILRRGQNFCAARRFRQAGFHGRLRLGRFARSLRRRGLRPHASGHPCDPQLPKAHYFAGQANILWQPWADAATEFTAELALLPTDPDAKFSLSFVDLQQSKTDEAAELFRQILVLHPDHAKTQYELGKMLLDHGR